MTVRLRRRRCVCARCGQTGARLEIHDRRVKRWRHLDLGPTRCVIECELRLLRCRDCRAEPVPWARPGAHHTRDFEDVVVRHEVLLNRAGCRAPPPGCRSSSVEAGGSLTLETQGRVGAAPTTPGRASTARWSGFGKRDREV